MPTKSTKPATEVEATKVEAATSNHFDVKALVGKLRDAITDGSLEAQKKAEIARIEGFYEGYKLAVGETLRLIDSLSK